MMIEKSLQDILNAGLGIFKAGEENLQTALRYLESAFADLKSKGASDMSESAVKLREVLENTIRGVKDVTTQAEENFNKVLAEAQKNYAQVFEQVKTVVGEERLNDLNSKIEELSGYIKTQVAGAQTAAAGVAEKAKTAASNVASSVKGKA
ncbi:MAG: hypothetical protein HS115_09975 [Spirochaetales bacterium]|nr:hypothetical protein [Spirochaetales bacterium]